jgi:hypothetical protein
VSDFRTYAEDNLRNYRAALARYYSQQSQIQYGQIGAPNSKQAAAVQSPLDVPQRAMAIGEPIPIVFCRYRNNAGGVLLSPGATEARFINSSVNAVTAYYHLVLSEGEISKIQEKDVFQRYCRVGSYNQSYNRRAGTWSPGNAIVQRAGYTLPECPRKCGTVGFYTGMSTLSFQSPAYPDGSDLWNRQVHLFVRGGINITRLYDNTAGPSDNFADLVNWIWTNSSKVPSLLIDTSSMQSAAVFLEKTGLLCNITIRDAQNVAEMITKLAPYFLLSESNNNGKKGLRPVLPVTSLGEINTAAITPDYLFTENEILPNSFDVSYISYTERQPFVVQAIWRQQLRDDVGIVRTAEVRYNSTAANGPYEQHDLSEFCTTELHAVRVGAYILAKRYHSSHTLQFRARPQQHTKVIQPGDIVRVKLARQTSTAGRLDHDYLYQVERISRTLIGEVSYECSHFPVDSQGRSLIALDVMAATPSGVLLDSNRTGLDCDVNSSSSNSIPSDVGQGGFSLGLGINGITPGLEGAASGGSTADDGLDDSTAITPTVVNPSNPGQLAIGGGIYSPSPCPNGTTEEVKWYRDESEVKGIKGNNYVIGTADITVGGSTIKAIWYCTDNQGNVTQTIVEPTAIPPNLSSLQTPGTILAYTGYILIDGVPRTYFSSTSMPTLVRTYYNPGIDFIGLSGVNRIIYVDAQFIDGSFLVDVNSKSSLVVDNVALINASYKVYGDRQVLWQPVSYTP